MNDIKDIRENSEKYRQMMRNRTNAAALAKDPQAAEKNAAEIDELLRVDKGARIAKTLVQNLHSQANIDTQLWELYNIPRKKPLSEEEKEKQASVLWKKLETLQQEAGPIKIQLNEWQQEDLQREIAHLDVEIAEKEAKIAECDFKQAEILAGLTSEQTAVLEEICEEIKRSDYFLQKGRGDGSIEPPRYRKA